MIRFNFTTTFLKREVESLLSQAIPYLLEDEAVECCLTEKETGLEVGDNLIAFPLKAKDLVSALRQEAQKIELGVKASFKIFEHCYVDRFAKKLWFDNKPNKTPLLLTEKEVMILDMLVQASGDMVSRGDFLKTVWGYHEEAETHTIETHIYRLRQKLNDYCGLQTDLIETELGGYSLAKIG